MRCEGLSYVNVGNWLYSQSVGVGVGCGWGGQTLAFKVGLGVPYSRLLQTLLYIKTK